MLESPWDLDLTFGLRWNAENDLRSYINYNPQWNYELPFTLIQRAKELGLDEINGQVAQRYQYLRSNKWSDETIQDMLDEFEADIYYTGAIKRDKDRWLKTAYNENFDDFRTYVLQRLTAMDQYILKEGG